MFFLSTAFTFGTVMPFALRLSDFPQAGLIDASRFTHPCGPRRHFAANAFKLTFQPSRFRHDYLTKICMYLF